MTLNEFARKLREVLEFRWLTVESSGYITLWRKKPKFSRILPGSKMSWNRGIDDMDDTVAYIRPKSVNEPIDFSDRRDESGRIDYSKCIVEVE